MENENLSGMHGLELTRHSAQAIVNDIGGIVHQNINMMDKNGVSSRVRISRGSAICTTAL